VTTVQVARRALPPVRPAPGSEQHEARAQHESECGAGSEPQRGHPQMVGVMAQEPDHARSAEAESEEDESGATEPPGAALADWPAARPPQREQRQQERGETDEGRSLGIVARPVEREEATALAGLDERHEVGVVPFGFYEVALVPELL